MAEEVILKTVLEEMRLSNAGSWSAGDALDQKANFIFAGGSVLFGILAALITTQQTISSTCIGKMIILVSPVILYLAMTIIFMFVISPRRYRTALMENKATIETEMIEIETRAALLSLIEGYIETIAYNRDINNKKARGVKWCTVIMVILVILLIAFGTLA